MGPFLPSLFQSRRKYRDVLASELAHAKTIESRFLNRYEGRAFAIEKRKMVKKPSNQSSEASESQLLDGRVYGVLHAKLVSVNLLLLRLLEQYEEEMRRRAAFQKKHKQTVCDVCGAFQAKLSVCSRCKTRRFCSTACQKKDWPQHKVKKKRKKKLLFV